MAFSELVKYPFIDIAGHWKLIDFRNTHVTFTDSAGQDVVGIVKSFGGGKYSIQTKNSDTVSVDEGKVSVLKVTDPGACPVAGK